MIIRMAPILGLVLLGGCAYHVAEQTDRAISDLARRSFDREPVDAGKQSAGPDGSPAQPAKNTPDSTYLPKVATDVLTAGYLNQAKADPKQLPPILNIPNGVPGTEVPRIGPFKDKADKESALKKLYGPLDALPEEPKALPGPGGRPYTLADLQDIAALNSPSLKQAASDVRAADGNLIQARTYANPTLAVGFYPSNDGETAGVPGFFFDQKISTFGKMKLATAAAQKAYDNAELALKRARSDLSTQVRTAYFNLLVAKETVRVNRAVSILTDEIYRYQVRILEKGGFAASYEPASLGAQAWTARLALLQSINTYQIAWMQLVTAIGLSQLPLSEVAGRIDSHIPYFDYDTVRNYVLARHTDISIARNGIDIANYNRKLAQVTPLSDIDFQLLVGKESVLVPFQWYAQVQVGVTLPLWDRNRGNIIAAEAAEVRAKEQVHVAALNLTGNLQVAFVNYQNNLAGIDFYRRRILPNLVMAYRGVLERRRDDGSVQFGDVVAAQQALTSSVATYLTTLASLWSSAVTVADFLQTDDFFQLADPKAVPALPDLDQLPCCHPGHAVWDAPNCGPRVQPAPGSPMSPPRPPSGQMPGTMLPPLLEAKP
jgi:outer membrane protein, heavy metal efflux system